MHPLSLLHGSAGEVTTPLSDTVQEAQLFLLLWPLLGQAGRDRLNHGRTVKHSTSLVHNIQCCHFLGQRSHLPTAGTAMGPAKQVQHLKTDGDQPGLSGWDGCEKGCPLLYTVDVEVGALGSLPGFPSFHSPLPSTGVSESHECGGWLSFSDLQEQVERMCQVTLAGPMVIFSPTFCPAFWMKGKAVLSRLKSAVPAAARSSSPEPALQQWGLRAGWTCALDCPHFFLPSQVICTYQQSPCGQGRAGGGVKDWLM